MPELAGRTIFVVPGIPNNIISRERLLKLLEDNLDKNLILVYSPAGYGKTVLVQDFLNKNRINAAWLPITEDIEHIYTFFLYMVHALKRINPDFGENTLQIIDSRRQKFQLPKNLKSTVLEIVITFVSELKKHFDKDITLVIDDLQLIEESKWFIDTFNTLIENLPAKLHLIIITRQIPDFNFVPLVIKGKILKVGMEELVFKSDEIKNLIENIYSFKCSEEGIQLLENNIGGWITGIHMILQSYGCDFDKLKIDSQKIPENIFNFLADTIYNHLDKECQSFMLKTVLIDNFSEDIINYLLDSKTACTIIKKLLNKNLLIETVSNGSGNASGSKTYNYQVLFKKFLLSKLYELPQESINQIMHKVVNYYKSRKDDISALNYLLVTNDTASAIPIIIGNFQKLFNEGRFEYLWKCLTSIDRDTVMQNPYLVYYMGIMYKFFAGDLETSLQYLQKAITGFEERNDSKNLINCHINKASVLLNLGRVHEAMDELTDFLKEQTTPVNKAKQLYYLSLAYYQNSQYDMAINLLNQSMDICMKESIEDTKRNIYNLLGHINLIKGEYSKSIKSYELSLDKNPNVIDRFETICNLILMYSQSANYNRAKEFLDELSEMVTNFPSPIFRLPYLLSKQAYLFEWGKYEDNIKVLNEILSIASSMHHQSYIYLSYRLLSDSYYHINELEKAQTYYEYACSNVDESNELEKMELAVVKALLRKRIELDPAIEFILLLAYDFYKNQRLEYSKAQVCYHLADFYFKNGKYENAAKYFEECLKLSKEKNYISYLYRELSISEALFDYALGNKIQEEFINMLKVSKLETVQQ